MSDWTLSVGTGDPQPMAALKIEDLTIEYVSRGTDTATLYAHPSVDWAYGTVIQIRYGGTRIFYGRVQLNEWDKELRARVITVPGVQYWLNRITFRQLWQIYASGALADAPSCRVILNAAGENAHLSADGQVQQIVAYAASRGAPLAFGSSSVGITLPYEEQRDISCRQALERVLRLTPSVCEWVDYAAAVPTLHYGTDAAFAPARVEAERVAYRHDLVCPGLQIEIERVNTVNGAQYRAIERLSAGDTDNIDSVFVSLPLGGREFSSTVRRLAVTTEAVGDYTGAAWWAARHPRLKDISPADVTMVSSSRGLLADQFPRISSNALPDLTAAGCKARLETFYAVCDIVKRDGDEIVSTEYDVNLEMQFVTTDATTKTYTWQESVSVTAAEPTPSGLAASLLAHWSVLYAQGTFTAPVQDGIPHPGQLVYDTPIQSVRISAQAATVTGTFGPPSHLSAQDFVAFLQGFRTVRKSLRYQARDDGKPAAEEESDQTVIAPVSASEWSPGSYGSLRVKDGGKTINLDPAALGDAGTAELHDLSYFDAEGNTQTVQALMSADVSIPAGGPGDFPPEGWSERASGIVDIQWDSSYHKIQVKRGTVLVKDNTEDASWSDLLTFGEFNV